MHLTTLFASDTLPDITPQGSGQLWPQMITARKILAMDPYMEQYGSTCLRTRTRSCSRGTTGPAT